MQLLIADVASLPNDRPYTNNIYRAQLVHVASFVQCTLHLSSGSAHPRPLPSIRVHQWKAKKRVIETQQFALFPYTNVDLAIFSSSQQTSRDHNGNIVKAFSDVTRSTYREATQRVSFTAAILH